MILTVTLNAAVDKTYRIEGFSLDRVHRPIEWTMAAGGKGINVARALKAFGEEAVATGFLGGYNGRYISGSLKTEGIEWDFVQTREESRVCIAVVDPIGRTQTEINEAGPCISHSELTAFKTRFRKLAASRRFRCAVLSGSVSPGVSSSIYSELIELARREDLPCALDASGEALQQGLEAHPWMVKPNIHELSSLVNKELDGTAEIVAAARVIQGTGVEYVLVTWGSNGAFTFSKDGVFSAQAPKIKFVSAVGSGDVFLGAYIWSNGVGRTSEDCLRIATGAGAANASIYGAGFIKMDMAFRLAEQVQIESLN